jgi:transcriptional regulator
MLEALVTTFESAYAQQWNALDKTYRNRMLNHIVGFEILVTQVETKFKLSQNRTPNEQERVMESLSRSEDTVISGTGSLMQACGLGTQSAIKKRSS